MYSYGLYSYSIYSYGLNRFGPCSCGLCIVLACTIMAYVAMASIGSGPVAVAYAHRFVQEGADVIKDLDESDQSKFVADLALPSIKVLAAVASNACYN